MPFRSLLMPLRLFGLQPAGRMIESRTMNPIVHRYGEIVRKALEFMRSRHGTKTSVKEIAAFVSVSQPHLRRIFRTVTGKAILPNLHDVQMEHARTLLRQTAMNIGEIAFAAGFEDPSSFARLFRRSEGTSPTTFRKALQAPTEHAAGATPILPAGKTRLLFSDDFSSGTLTDHWQPLLGIWTQSEGRISTSGSGNSTLRLASPLPENFRMDFDIMLAHERDYLLRLFLCDDQEPIDRPYCTVQIRKPATLPGALRIGTRTMVSGPQASLPAGGWHSIRTELNDNTVTFTMDGKRIFLVRDLFPPLYSSRSRFAISISSNDISIRNFRLQDLGFMTVVPAVRQGDALFNSGLFDQARDFYLRRLQPDLAADEEMELRFKIGMCLFRKHEPDQCRKWIESILHRTPDPYWARECNILLLRLDEQANDFDVFVRKAKKLARDPLILDGIRPIISGYKWDLLAAAFHERAIQLDNLSIAIDKGQPAIVARFREQLTQTLKHMKHLAEAERQLKLLTRPGGPSVQIRHDAFISLSDVYILQGKMQKARQAIESVRRLGETGYLPWCTSQQAACLLSERRYGEAVDRFLSIRKDFPKATNWHPGADMQAATILCCLGKTKAADRLAKRADDTSLEALLGNEYQFGRYQFLRFMVARRYKDLAKAILEHARSDARLLAIRAKDAVTAGILLELSGSRDEAVKIWEETQRRFTPDRCYFWGQFARALATGKADNLESVQLTYQVRSGLFYLTGLLHEHRGNKAKAAQLFSLSLKEDPTMRWPAMLSERKLATT
ncbi:MAG: hypothetical protein C0404_13910 [Verrucomicrobia bacterium]|nr:hypothetical protein [Verrucomicrobiota bacterium]